ncbi:hypothetical protein [Rubinisphaera italica]|uniref:DUF4199 domain-containing protein n=1 Tax=Rubinisphaera italica TaxID=2527969 RepID=A0A5C5XJD9_9PLAN|nr:hypothetical protein [Rubinisphaera italica]TWT63326.1 hypothetical protein Pan54_40790 [Rubinisphaera italica]
MLQGNMQTVRWLLIVMMIAVALSLIAVWLPSGIKKIGLFSIALGAALGYLTCHFAGSRPENISRWQLIVVVLLAGMAETGRSVESYRQFRMTEEKRLSRELEELPAFAQEMRQEIRSQHEVTFRDYLTQKYSALSLGKFPSLIVAIFILEVLLSMVGAFGVIWLLRRRVPAKNLTDEQITD